MTKRILERADAWEYALYLQEPKLRVAPGEKVVIQTNDAFNERIQSSKDLITLDHLGDMWHRNMINPVGGPIHIEGAEPGDVLVVNIEDIIPVGRGYIATEENLGPLANNVKHPSAGETFTRMVDIEPGPSGTTSDGIAHIEGGITWNVAPMIGCAGVVPLKPEEGNDTATMQCAYGGNLDVDAFRKGSQLLIPVAHPGGLFYAGDVHASQSTEFMGTPIEVAADIHLSFELIKNKSIPFIRVITEDSLIQLYARRPWDVAVEQAYIWMLDWLVDDYDMDAQDAVVHFNANPDVHVRVYSAPVDKKTQGVVGVTFPKTSL